MEQMMKNTTIVEADRKDLVDSLFSSFSSISSSESFSGSSSLESDSSEEVTSPDPLLDMSSLFQQLPIKRGLSKHYDGKSQSFTSLANVRSLEDLAKPENPYNKKMRCCRRSYGGGLMAETENCDSLSRQMSERSTRGSCSSISVKKERGNMGITRRPPMAPHRSTSTSTIHSQTPLFA